jgi:hypothetical protein
MFETYLEIDLNNSKDRRKRALLQWATPAVVLGPASESSLAHLGLSTEMKQGSSPHSLPMRGSSADRW